MEVLLKNVYKKFQTVLYNDHNDVTLYNVDPQFEFGMNFSSNSGYYWKHIGSSTKEEDFKANYGNPSCSVWREIVTLVLERNHNKLSLKVFINSISRPNGLVYFRKATKLLYLTYNLETKDLYNGEIIGYHKKRRGKISKVNKNPFFKRPVNTFFSKIKTITNAYVTFDNSSEIMNDVVDFFREFAKQIGINPASYNNLDIFLFEKNMLKKQFKLPNNFASYLNIYPILNKKESKKFKGKFIEAIMERSNLSGGRFKKLLHQLEYFNLKNLDIWYKSFGEDFVKSLSDYEIKKILEKKEQIYFQNFSVLTTLLKSKNFRSIINLVIDEKIDFYTFSDHVTFYNKLNKFEPTEWKSYDFKTFMSEHLYYSERIEFYNNGIYNRYYDEYFVKSIEKEILVGDSIYNPIILHDTTTYCDESAYQSNCVRTYIKKPESLIISLRKNSDRATLEYRITKYNDKIKMERVQSRFRFNQAIPDSWSDALEKLDLRIENFLRTNTFVLPKITVCFKNGKKLSAKMTFTYLVDQNLKPTWERNTDEKIGTEVLDDERKNFRNFLEEEYSREYARILPIQLGQDNIFNEIPF